MNAVTQEHLGAATPASAADVSTKSLEHSKITPRSKRIAPPDTSNPIFLHSLWRSGSTYVWSRFRTVEGTCCYYEPLNDGLGKLTADRITRATPEEVAVNSHPALGRPYYAEFEPLLDGGRGVRDFRKRFAYHQFALAPDAEDPQLEAYVRSLVDHARGGGQRAVLGLNRSDLRIGWMRRKFPSFNVIVEREPLDVFASYLSQMARGNAYYFEKLMLIGELNASSRLFDYPNSLLRTRSPIQRLFLKSKPFYRDVAEAAPKSSLYAIAFHAWIVRLLHGLSHGDLVMDLSQAGQPGYRETLSDEVEAACGLRVDFQTLRVAEASTTVDLPDQAAIEQEVLDHLPMSALEPFIDRVRIRGRLSELSPRKAAVVERLL